MHFSAFLVFIIGTTVAVLCQPAQAEYRSFLLQIKSADGKDTQVLKTSLDPDQYRGYFQTKAGDHITYLETWKCKGNTANRPICQSPREIAAQEKEAAASGAPSPP